MITWYKHYTGYVREGFTYLTYPFRPKAEPATKFVIFTVGRAGSSLLVTLLQSHPQINCDNELFQRKLFTPLNYLRFKERLSSKSVYGFKLNTYHFRIQKTEDPLQFVRDIHNAGYKILSLKRRNLLRQVISHMFAVHRNMFHRRSSQNQGSYPPFVVSLDKLKEELAMFESYRALRDEILEHFPHFDLCYEDDLLDSAKHQMTVDNISDFLEVPSSSVETSLRKTTPRELSSFMVNFDEVEAFLRDTKYANFLDMD